MITAKNFLFLSLCLFFPNAYGMKHVDKMAYLCNVYRAKKSWQLFRVIHAGEFQGTPVITYQEVREGGFLNNKYKPVESSIHNPFTTTKIVDEKTFNNIMTLYDTNCSFK